MNVLLLHFCTMSGAFVEVCLCASVETYSGVVDALP